MTQALCIPLWCKQMNSLVRMTWRQLEKQSHAKTKERWISVVLVEIYNKQFSYMSMVGIAVYIVLNINNQILWGVYHNVMCGMSMLSMYTSTVDGCLCVCVCEAKVGWRKINATMTLFVVRVCCSLDCLPDSYLQWGGLGTRARDGDGDGGVR